MLVIDSTQPNSFHLMLTAPQINTYLTDGFLHLPHFFSGGFLAELSDEMDRLMTEWAERTPGWTGDWRKKYMDTHTESKARLIAMHDLQHYSSAWMRAVTHPQMAELMVDLLGPDVEFHHSTMHVKPPEAGHPFPLHQDNAFYEHHDNRYVDVLVHLDDTSHANGEIRFLPGSHLGGYLPHIQTDQAGKKCAPHLPTDTYHLEQTVPVPAQAGDLVLFNIFTIHGSYLNTTDRDRRMVRVGYRTPDNEQIAGQSLGRPGFMLAGQRHQSNLLSCNP